MLLNNDSNTGSSASLNLQVFPLFFIRFAYAGNPLGWARFIAMAMNASAALETYRLRL